VPARWIYQLVLLAAALASLPLWGADPPADKTPARLDEAVVNQEILGRQFREFEQSLLRLAQRLERSPKPEDRDRAANLKKAIALAGDQGVDAKFERLSAVLRGSKDLSLQELKEAMEENRMVTEDIKSILALLMTDNRDLALKKEKERLTKLLNELKRITRQQKVVRAQTESGRLDAKPLGQSQAKVTGDTQKLASAMEGKKGEVGKGQDKSGSSGKSGDKGGGGESGEGTPGQKQVQEANQHQKQAEQRIADNKQKEASGQQDKAIEKLEQAQEKLEEILRQLREEEQERLLAALQLRCERMLQMQIEVYEQTVRVDRAIQENPDHKPARANEQRSLQLSDREDKIAVEADQAIQLLREEGSAVAFPEVFMQVRDDMRIVARRLGKADVAAVTQVIEKEIISTLTEMIDALKKAQKNLQNRRNNPSAGGGSNNQKLIDQLAELKMIRAMQVRVNTRTQVYGQRYTGEQADDPDIQKELSNLAERQMKIFQITQDIYRGNNK
jgi:hypothetical protein